MENDIKIGMKENFAKVSLILLSIFLFSSLFVHSVLAYDIDVYPTEWTFNMTQKETKQKTFTVYNNENQTITVSITFSGNLPLALTASQLTISAYGSKQFVVTVYGQGLSPGEYSSNITVDSKVIEIKATVVKWVSRDEVEVKRSQTLEIEESDYSFKVKDITYDGVTIDVMKAGSYYETIQLSIGESYEYEDVKLTLKDRYGDSSFFIVETVYENPTIDVTGAVVSAQGNFRFLEPSYSVQVGKGTQPFPVTFTLINNYGFDLTLQSYAFEGTGTIIVNGVRYPIRLENFKPGTILKAGSTLTLLATVDPDNLDIGDYQSLLTITGLYGGDAYIAQLPITISIKTTISGAPTGPLNISIPDYYKPNENLEIKVINLPTDAVVWMQPEPYLVGEARYEGSNWIWTGKITKEDNATIIIAVMRYGSPIKYVEKTLRSTRPTKNITLEYYPSPPQHGDKVGIFTDADRVVIKVYKNDRIVDQFLYTDKFEVSAGYKYCLHAEKEGYNPVDTCFEIPLKNLQISVYPEPKLKGTSSITCISEGQVAYGASVWINGQNKNSPSVPAFTWTIGNYTIECKGPGFNPARKDVVILPPPKVVKTSGECSLEHDCWFYLNRKAAYKIMVNDTVVSFGTEQNITFTPHAAGSYTLYVEDTPVYQFEVKQGGFKFALNEQTISLIVGIAILGAAFFLVYKIIKRRRRIRGISRGRRIEAREAIRKLGEG